MYPLFTAVTPSTSFTGKIAFITFSFAICFGNGSSTKIPCVSLSLLSFSINLITSSSGVSSGISVSSTFTPTLSPTLILDLAYHLLAGSPPTKITANLGVNPFSFNFSVSAIISFLISSAIGIPLIIFALIFLSFLWLF